MDLHARNVLLLSAGMMSVLLSAAAASANDTAAGGSGSDLVPLEVADVRMASEDIVIRAAGASWDVQADYVFENLGDRAIELQVGFPEYACEGGDPETEEVLCDPRPLHFKSMVTTVDGAPVTHRRGTFRKGHAWLPRLGQVWLYDVRFAPHRATRISHRYRVSAGQISDGTMLGTYVTRTGAPWAGTIGRARFRIQVPVESSYVDFETQRSGLTVTKHVVQVDGRNVGEVLLEGHDWEPNTDLAFSYRVMHGAPTMETWERAISALDGTPLPTERCPKILALMARGEERAKPSAIRAEDVEQFVREGIGDARICRNYVFAAHGRRFHDQALNRYFYPKGFSGDGWPYQPYEPNPAFELALLDGGDWATLKLIGEVERANATDW